MTLREKFLEPTKVPNVKGVWVEDLDAVNQCVKIADEFAIEFANWFVLRYTEAVFYRENYTEILLEEFKKEKGL
jgi:hypothetical protein